MSVSTGRSAAVESPSERSTRDRLLELFVTIHTLLADPFGTARKGEMAIMNAIKTVGGSLIGLAMIVIVLNEVFTIPIVNNSEGPFASVMTSLTNTGGAALTLLVVVLLVIAASYIMGVMDRF